MRYNRTVAIPETAFAAAGVPVQGNLPTNPMSHLVLMFRFLNDGAEATLANILAAVANIEVLWNGEQIYQLNGFDAFAFQMHLFGQTPIQGNEVATDNAARWFCLTVPFARVLYMPSRGLPATKSGQLLCRVTPAAAFTAMDGMTLQVEAVEMLGANPEKTMKVTTLNPLIGAAGDNDIDIPREGLLNALMLFATTVPTGTAFTKSINSIQLLNNNKQDYVCLASWEGMRGEHAPWMGEEASWITAGGAPNDDNYIFMDLQPNNVEDWNLDTDPLNQLKLKINSGDTQPIRILPARWVPAADYSNPAG